MMNDNELDELIRTTARDVPAQADAALDELASAIVGSPTQASRRRFYRPLIAAAASVAVLTGVLAMQTNGSGAPAYAAEVVAVAEAAPRVLVGTDGWRVTRADEFAPEMGEVTFERGAQRLDVQWVPAAGASADKLSDESDIHDHATVAGHEADVYRYSGTDDYTAWWTDDDALVEARGVFASLPAFKELLGSMREVGVDEWLAAMPESVITPSHRSDVVDRMLIGVKTPPGFNADALRTGTSVKDRYQLAAAVSSAVACGWIENWIAAFDAGNVAAANTAVQAMSDSHSWPVLHEMQRDGDYPKVLWQIADAMAIEQRGGSSNIPAGYKHAHVRDTYRDSLGCN
jgi:hypothetical protein